MEASPYFKYYGTVVDATMIKNLLASFSYQIRSNPAQRPKIWGIDKTSTPLAFTLVRLYSNQTQQDNSEQFKNLELGGIWAFCVDRRTKSHNLRLFDINEFRLLFQCEVFVNMNSHYKRLRPNFYCFPLPSLVLGVEYVNFEDAEYFQMLINKYCPKLNIQLGDSQIKTEHTISCYK